MPATPVVCPTCQSSLDVGALICGRCRTVVHDDYLATVLPLLLPGAPGLSPDASGATRRPRLAGAAAACAAITVVAVTVALAASGEPAADRAVGANATVPSALPQLFIDSIAPLVLAADGIDRASLRDASLQVPDVIVDSASGHRRAEESMTRVPATVGQRSDTLARALTGRETAAPPSPPVIESGPIPLVAITSSAVAPQPGAPAPSATAPQETPPLAAAIAASTTMRPEASDVRVAVAQFVGSLRRASGTNFELGEFFGDGESHRVTVAREPSEVRATLRSVRVAFELRLSKFDAAGRQFTRLMPVSLDVSRSDDAFATSAVEFGAWRKP